MKAKVIAVANQKGGSGKTAATLSLGVALSMHGKRVLLVDADPQGDLTKSLGLGDPDSIETTIASHIENIVNDTPLDPHDGIVRSDENVDLMPANIRLADTEASLFLAMNRERIFSTWLADLKSDYDYVLIDCMPSLGMLPVNALAAADSVLITVSAEYLPAVAMTALIKTIERVKRQINPELAIEGALLTLFDRRTRIARQVEKKIRNDYGSSMRVFETAIPRAVAASEAPAYGESIFAYDPDGKVAKAYKALCEEVLNHA